MGLTIHYELRAGCGDPATVRARLEALRGRALDLPFAEVGPIVDLEGAAADNGQMTRDDENFWLAIQACAHVKIGGNCTRMVPAKRILAFSAWPGAGCEEANFGFCLYPATTEGDGGGRVRVPYARWSWSSFCKTQYAANEEEGGVPNFLKCHTTVIRLLDHAKALGILAEVNDEGEYWEKRSLQALAQEVGEWNEMIAGYAAQLKGTWGEDRVVTSL